MPLSVLQCASNMPNWGGAEMHLLSLSEQLRLRGHEVTVACQPGRWVEAQARQMGLPTVPVTVDHLNDRRDMGRLYRWLRDHKVDVLHAHAPDDFVLPPLTAIASGVPVRVMTRHLPHPLDDRRRARLYSRILFSRIVSVSESVRQTLIQCGMDPARVETIHHGTDVEAFAQTTMTAADSRAALGIPDGAIAVGIVGRIAVEKGHRYLLEAVELLKDRYPLHVVVVGDGPELDAVKGMTRDLALQNRTAFTGFREDVNNVIAALDVVVTASVWAEPCSAVVQQAMSLAKPVIGTRVGGTPEMIVEGETGLLVPIEDAGAMAESIAALAGNVALRQRMGAAGRSRVQRLFTLSGMTDRIEALYYRMGARGRRTFAEMNTARSTFSL